MKQLIKAGAAKAASWLPDALMVGGASALSYGAWMIFPAAGFVVAGCLALVAGYLLARSNG